MSVAQRWILEEGNKWFPVNPDIIVHETPGPGVFQFFKNGSMNDQRMGLMKLSDKFDFDFKIYDLGSEGIIQHIYDTWNSEYFEKENKNLGVIFNGIKGTGKTISAKLLCNKMEMPVIVIPYCVSGIQDFIQNLDFECVILIDEAEKTFKDTDTTSGSEILLKLIDGVYNRSRKLYILTTNRLDISENLIGRPGRIKYIHEFGNLSEKAINEFIDDNLLEKYKDQKSTILKTVDLLEISTIDILRSIVDEVNIHGKIDENTDLNIPKSKYIFDLIDLENTTEKEEELVIKILKPHFNKDLSDWIDQKYTGEFTDDGEPSSKKIDQDQETLTNLEKIDSLLSVGSIMTASVASSRSKLYKGEETNIGTIVTVPDKDTGIFKVRYKSCYGSTKVHTCIYLGGIEKPSLYYGGLVL